MAKGRHLLGEFNIQYLLSIILIHNIIFLFYTDDNYATIFLKKTN